MNEEAFIILVMNLSSYDKAKMVQMLFVRAFHNMKQILQQHTNASWIEARETGKIERLAETDTIRDFVDYAEKQGNTKARFYYSTLTKMTYKALELVNCETPIRDILNSV
jgi:phage regulator Rha-like protein